MRSGGILMHISSLPSPYGIGTMGVAAREFVDFLAAAGQRYWQTLPICPTSYGDSPYQSFSTYAGNPYFIDLDVLNQAGYLEKSDYQSIDWEGTHQRVNYGALYEKRYPVLRIACGRLLEHPPTAFDVFCQQNAFWLEDYALFMALKDSHGGLSWQQWEEPLRLRQVDALNDARTALADEMAFWKCVQYLFFAQWDGLKAYAHSVGVNIIGDLPIYVAVDSVDVWANPQQFQLDGNGSPTEVAGCPPDDYAPDGQLWGNPLFNWDYMKADGYRWWIARVAHSTHLFDVVRIDHFRGFEAYYAIPYGAPNARDGRWCVGPGIDLFRAIEGQLGKRSIIAEDLGFLTPGVQQMLEESGFPGMKVLEFAFCSGEDSAYMPHNHVKNCVVYTGTHDNDTILGWWNSAPAHEIDCATRYLQLTPQEGIHWGMMRGGWSSVADLVVVQMQDVLGLGGEGRMNVPATLGGNWQWRMPPDAITHTLTDKLKEQMVLYCRTPLDK